MASSESPTLAENLKSLPKNLWRAVFRHGVPTSDRARSQTVFSNVFLHVHSARVHPHSLRLTATWGLGVSLVAQFIILTVTGVLLMVYYMPSTAMAYDSMKDIHYVVPAGRVIRNVHRWASHMMVIFVILHMMRVFYTSAYKRPREFNWLIGMVLFVLTLALAFTGYILPWDQLAYWALTIAANIAASPNEVAEALGLSGAFKVGDLQKELLLGSSEPGQHSLIRFYTLHCIFLPILIVAAMAVHFWRIRKDGGLARPEGTPTPAGKGAASMEPPEEEPSQAPTKSYGLMCVIRDKSPHTGKDPDETVPSWPYLMRAELLVFMLTMLVCVALGVLFDAPLRERANPAVPENPARAPWYFLGLQEMVSYSAFVSGIVIPTLAVLGLGLVAFLDREPEPSGVWFSGSKGRRVALKAALFGTVCAVLAVAIPVNFGWLRNWFPEIPQWVIILFNPGSLLTVAYAVWSLIVTRRTGSTRMGAIALFTCFIVGFIIL
ncbi:MAG: cytochrome b N-terminal domain-containing protein, partial [Planctomycetota bacterium]